MQSRLTNQNQNYKIFAKLRPIDYSQKMVDATNECVSIRDPSNKNAESKLVNFSSVCQTQEHAFKIAEPMLQKLIEGHNSCLLCYGQTGSGKSYTLYGVDGSQDDRSEKRGLLSRSVEYLLSKGQEFEEIREFVITASIAEVFLDQVRDLGKAYTQKNQNIAGLLSNYENENLTIYENTNGQIMIKDLALIPIRSLSDLHELMQAGLSMRDKLEQQGQQFSQKCHTIVSLNLVQKDKENENLPFMNATIQFVDLAGSERIAKSLTEGNKFQEAILVNASLTALGKCLTAISQMNSKNIPYREAKLTRILQNCLNSQSQVALIVHLNPSESNFEECLSALQYAERTKGVQNNQAQEDQTNTPGPFPGQDKLIKKLNEEISDLKSKIEYMTKEHRSKISEIQNLLGIDVDLEKLFAKSSAKELSQFKIQKDAMQKVETLQQTNREQEQMIEKLTKQIEDMKKEDLIRHERQQCQIIELREKYKRLQEKQAEDKQKLEMAGQEKNQNMISLVKKELETHQKKIEEKVSVIINLPQNIQTKTQEAQKVEDIKRMAKLELEKEYKVNMENLRQENQKLLKQTTEQFEHYLRMKNDELDRFIQQFKKYQEKKKGQIQALKHELFELYDVCQKAFRVIEKIEEGAYSSGIRSFNIPFMDKPILPSRTKFKNLFKYLDQRSFNVTKHTQSSSSLTSYKQVASDFLEYTDIKMDLGKLDASSLMQFSKKVQEELQNALLREKELLQRIKVLEVVQKDLDLQTLVRERDEYKQLYFNEIKKLNQSRRIISGRNDSASMFKITRPMTQQNSRYKL